jgi:lysozyme
MNQGILDRVMERLRAKEGLRLKPYKDTKGLLTIGYGRCLETKGISIRDAEFMLSEDVIEAIGNLKRVLPKLETYSEQRQVALIDMMFNLGMGTFMEFVKMIYAIEIGDWDEAARQSLDSLYAKQVGPRAVEVAKMLKEG